MRSNACPSVVYLLLMRCVGVGVAVRLRVCETGVGGVWCWV